jgi:sugar phosphate isomerase/epimerase
MKKTWTWSTTGFTFGDKGRDGLSKAAEVCAAAGLAGIEGAAPLFSDMSDREIQRAGEEFRSGALRIDTFHIPFAREDDIAAFYETERRAAVATVSRWMERAALVGATVCIQHPTCNRYSVDAEGLDRYLSPIARSLETLLPLAERLGLTIAVENMLPASGGRFCSRPGHFERLGAMFPHRSLGWCLDTGHALVAGQVKGAMGFFEAMRSRLVAFHLADNAGDRDSHLAPGRGRVDWKAFFRAAAGLGFDRSMCIETPPFGPGPDYRLEDFKAMVAETSALCEAALA